MVVNVMSVLALHAEHTAASDNKELLIRGGIVTEWQWEPHEGRLTTIYY
ncbi:MAG: hypothetical protein ACI4FV_11590 [Lachnospiraceae bacterium]